MVSFVYAEGDKACACIKHNTPLKISTSLIRKDFSLEITISNCRDQEITVTSSDLPWSNTSKLTRYARYYKSGDAIDSIVFFLHNSPKKITVKPHETIFGSIDLNELFVLNKKKVDKEGIILFWQYDLPYNDTHMVIGDWLFVKPDLLTSPVAHRLYKGASKNLIL